MARASSSASFQNLCGVSGGTTTLPPGPMTLIWISTRTCRLPDRPSNVSSVLEWMCSGGPTPWGARQLDLARFSPRVVTRLKHHRPLASSYVLPYVAGLAIEPPRRAFCSHCVESWVAHSSGFRLTRRRSRSISLSLPKTASPLPFRRCGTWVGPGGRHPRTLARGPSGAKAQPPRDRGTDDRRKPNRVASQLICRAFQEKVTRVGVPYKTLMKSPTRIRRGSVGATRAR